MARCVTPFGDRRPGGDVNLLHPYLAVYRYFQGGQIVSQVGQAIAENAGLVSVGGTDCPPISNYFY